MIEESGVALLNPYIHVLGVRRFAVLGHVLLVLEVLGDRSAARAVAESATFERFEPEDVDRYRSKFSKFKELLASIGVKMW